jgi:Caspase domain
MRGNFDLRIRGVQSVHNQKMRAPDHIISKFLLDVAIRNHLPEVSWFIPSGLGMIFVRLLLISAVILSASTTFSAHAAKRVALVIGNSGYENVTRLPNPANDATAITAILKEAGFVVDTRRDLKTADMRRALRDFADTSRDADVAVVYYAGHGMEVDGTNYLIPVDAALERDLDVYDEAVPLERVLVTIEPAKQLRLVMLDACRDNPFARSMKRTNGTRAVGRGLAKVEPSSPNTLIAFASKAGSTAADGDGKNSPFTIALVKHIGTPGLDLRRAFGYVRDEVLKATGSRQEPYVYGSLGGDDVPLVPAKPVASQSATNPQAEFAGIMNWQSGLARGRFGRPSSRSILTVYTPLWPRHS